MSPKSDFWALGVLTYLLVFRNYPFSQESKKSVFTKILNCEFAEEFESADRVTHKFIKDLLNVNVQRRLGDQITEFLQHDFFKGFDWKPLMKQNPNYSYLEKINESELLFSKHSSSQKS